MEPDERPLSVRFPHIQWDYGDDIRDYEKKENEAWNKELRSNPIYRRCMEATESHKRR